MNPKRLQLLSPVFVVLLLNCAGLGGATAANWPQFRGPQAGGVNDLAETPLTWDVDAGRNIRWQQSIPGLAHASPIVWDRRIYLATAVKPMRLSNSWNRASSASACSDHSAS